MLYLPTMKYNKKRGSRFIQSCQLQVDLSDWSSLRLAVPYEYQNYIFTTVAGLLLYGNKRKTGRDGCVAHRNPATHRLGAYPSTMNSSTAVLRRSIKIVLPRAHIPLLLLHYFSLHRRWNSRVIMPSIHARNSSFHLLD